MPLENMRSQESLLAEIAENLRFLQMSDEDVEKRGLNKDKLYNRAKELYAILLRYKTNSRYQDMLRQGYIDHLKRIPLSTAEVESIILAYDGIRSNGSDAALAFAQMMSFIADLYTLPAAEWDNQKNKIMLTDELVRVFHHLMEHRPTAQHNPTEAFTRLFNDEPPTHRFEEIDQYLRETERRYTLTDEGSIFDEEEYVRTLEGDTIPITREPLVSSTPRRMPRRRGVVAPDIASMYPTSYTASTSSRSQ